MGEGGGEEWEEGRRGRSGRREGRRLKGGGRSGRRGWEGSREGGGDNIRTDCSLRSSHIVLHNLATTSHTKDHCYLNTTNTTTHDTWLYPRHTGPQPGKQLHECLNPLYIPRCKHTITSTLCSAAHTSATVQTWKTSKEVHRHSPPLYCQNTI